MSTLKLLPLGLALLVAGLMASGSCTYAPDFENGKLLCGANDACPKGYTCMADHTCGKTGSTTTGTGGAIGTGGVIGTGGATGSGGATGTGGTIGNSATRANLIGTWHFTSGTLTINCSDNTSQTKPLMGPKDYIEINEGPGQAIVGSYYCDWVLDLAIVAGRASTVVRPTQTCTTSSGGTDFTWNATTFAFTSNNGATGALNSTIQATYKDATGTGTCKLVVMGNLEKAP